MHAWYPLPPPVQSAEGVPTALHRVRLDHRVHSVLVLALPAGPAAWLIDENLRGGFAGAGSTLGFDLTIEVAGRGRVTFSAVRPGIAAGDDELVGQLVSWSPDGPSDWLTAPVPTPRGQVCAALLRSLDRSRVEAAAREPVFWPPSGVSQVDDTELLVNEFGLTQDRARASRLRTWHLSDDRGGAWVVLPEPDDPDAAEGWLGWVFGESEGLYGLITVDRSGGWQLHQGGLRPFTAPIDSSSLPPVIHRVCRVVARALAPAQQQDDS